MYKGALAALCEPVNAAAAQELQLSEGERYVCQTVFNHRHRCLSRYLRISKIFGIFNDVGEAFIYISAMNFSNEKKFKFINALKKSMKAEFILRMTSGKFANGKTHLVFFPFQDSNDFAFQMLICLHSLLFAFAVSIIRAKRIFPFTNVALRRAFPEKLFPRMDFRETKIEQNPRQQPFS